MILPGYPNLWYRIHGILTALHFLLLQLTSLSQFSPCSISPFHENHGSRIYKINLLKFNWSLLESQQPHFFIFFFHYFYLNTSCHGSQYQVEFQFMGNEVQGLSEPTAQILNLYRAGGTFVYIIIHLLSSARIIYKFNLLKYNWWSQFSGILCCGRRDLCLNHSGLIYL